MDDVDAETLLKMLCHIYNEEITEEQMDRKLLEAARRYQLDNLVSILRQMFQKARIQKSQCSGRQVFLTFYWVTFLSNLDTQFCQDHQQFSRLFLALSSCVVCK